MHQSFMESELKQKLQIILKQLQTGDEQGAEKNFKLLHIVDTPAHLSLPHAQRHLIWDLYEYLVVGDHTYISKQELLSEFEDIIGAV